jgi:transcriptional regulator with XRE-family HTH domain
MAKKPHTEAAAHIADRPPVEFAQELGKYLQELEWSQSKLAQRANISDAQLSRWLTSRDRALGRNHVCRLSAALASGFLEKTGCEWRVEFLDTVLNDLLLAAGYAAVVGRVQDRVWARLTSKEGGPLRVGWIEYPPFSESPGLSRSATQDPVGLAAEITGLLADLTGLQVAFVQCEWRSIIEDLRKGRIDLISPFLIKLPTRMVSFSTEIPNLFLGLNGIFHASLQESTKTVLSTPAGARSKSIVAHAISGEVGESLGRIVLPGAFRGEPYSSPDEAAERIMREPTDSSKRIRCLVADQAICVYLQKKYAQSFLLLNDDLRTPPVKLPIAFAAHPEEPQLISLVDQCIQLMTINNFIEPLISEAKADLEEYGVILTQA